MVENSAVLLYAAAGAGDDWAKGGAGIELAFTVELPDGGLSFCFIYNVSFDDFTLFLDAPYFFMIPARQILPAVRETFEGVRAFHGYIEEKFWINATINDMLREV